MLSVDSCDSSLAENGIMDFGAVLIRISQFTVKLELV